MTIVSNMKTIRVPITWRVYPLTAKETGFNSGCWRVAGTWWDGEKMVTCGMYQAYARTFRAAMRTMKELRKEFGGYEVITRKVCQ